MADVLDTNGPPPSESSLHRWLWRAAYLREREAKDRLRELHRERRRCAMVVGDLIGDASHARDLIMCGPGFQSAIEPPPFLANDAGEG